MADLLLRTSDRIYTRNLDPGGRVYGERLLESGGVEYREWSPYRSKLSAYITLGGGKWPMRDDLNVLYLGAASGTTASHVSDLVPRGMVYCVEFSPRTFRDLVRVCGRRGNMVPILGDAAEPSGFGFAVGEVDLVYQDVAQKRQPEILMRNMDRFSADIGFVSIKARSEDVVAPPERIFRDSERTFRENGLGILDSVPLEPFEKDHRMVVVVGR